MGFPKQRAPSATIEEYLEFERRSEAKHEYIDGEIVAMAGATADASLIAANIIAYLGNALEGKPCRVYSSKLRIRIAGHAICTYPHASVICGPVQFDPDDPAKTTVMNPCLIVEVAPPNAARLGGGDKFKRYRRMPSLEEYVLVSQEAPRIEIFQKSKDGSWVLREYEGLRAVAVLKSVRVKVPLRAVFSNVEFDAA
jgi:Uma2 family endonuclease